MERIWALAKTSQKIRNEKDHQNGAQPNAGTTSITPATVTVISTAATQHQNQDNDQDQHAVLRFLFIVSGPLKPSTTRLRFNSRFAIQYSWPSDCYLVNSH